MKRALALLLALIMAFGLLAGCGSKPADGGQDAAADAGAEWDGTITIVQSSDIIGWDPCASADVNTKNCMKNLLNRTFETDENLKAIPIMVESFEQLDDLNWTFTLKEGIKFFDGTPCTANDVKFSVMRARETSSSGKSLYGPIEEFNVVDDRTFTIKTANVYNSLPTALSNTSGAVLSQAWVEKADAGECTWEDVMKNGATGRYYLGEHVIGDHVTLIANENYFDYATDGAKNKQLIFKVIPEATTRTIMVQTGEADVNVNFDTVAMAECQADPNVQVIQHESSRIDLLILNTASKAFADKRVRQAVAFAVNRDDCLSVGAEGYGAVCYSSLSPSTEGYVDNPAGYKYDVEKAKALMAEAGVTSLDVKAAVKTDAEERIMQVVQANLKEIGINLTFSRVDNTVLTELMANNEYDMCMNAYAHYQDPELFYGRYLGTTGIGANNYAHYQSAEADAAIAAAATTDAAVRQASLEELCTIICEDVPWVGLYTEELYCLARAGVKGVNMNLETTYWYHTICY